MQAMCLILLAFVVNVLGQSDFEALLVLKNGIEEDPSGKTLISWDSNSLSSDGCPRNWFGVTCIDGRVTSINLNALGLVGNFSFPVIVGLSMLQNLSVSGNSLTGTILQIGSFQSLRFLDLSCNMFHGSMPSNIGELKNLVLLNLSSNNFEGNVPSGFSNLGQLKYLDLQGNGFSGDVMNLLSQLASVEHVNLGNNQFSGSLDLGLGKSNFISSIKHLNVSHNSIVGELFAHDGMPYFDNLEVFDASNNKLVGTIPSFSLVVSLRILRLGGNQLSGSLPTLLLEESSMMLSELDLSFNQLRVDLSDNYLSGHLPEEISTFRNLEYLSLSNNKFEGSLPSGLPDELKGFNVSFNNLSGVVPENLRRFPDAAFHPGNSLLVFPHSPSITKGEPDLTLREHRHTKPAIRVALIASLLGGAALIALFSIIIYVRVHQGHKRDSVEGNGGKKSVQHGDSSHSHSSAPNRNLDPSLSSSFNQGLLASAQLGPAYESGDTSLVEMKPKTLSYPESVRKDEVLSPRVSFLRSGNPSPCRSPLSSDNAPGLYVCSPDKLLGDLHIFDGSIFFTAEELSHAPAETVGRSCHGTLYRAALDSGHVLAVKWLREGIAKGRKEFSREVKKLGSIKHPNLVSLLGYYWGPKEHEKLIISNYIDAQCLALYLQETEPRKLPPLSLNERLRVAVDVARCLNYLHNEKIIPHGNLKSTNILLEAPNLNARLTDYSLHRILTPAGTAEQVLNAGALGYRPPEFASSSKPCPSLKSDVYAFGVILLELLTGKSPGEILSGDPGIVDLTDWVRLLAGESRSIECFDRMLVDRHSEHHPPRILNEMLQVALRCILSASERPDMKSVFEDLSQIAL
ncbi:probable inactive receptor kinase At5g10020 [Carica papaya]|uniref:probable inactive receptor kinase At5g10020 n=1 Tax=Carica papaya TaxID=3649 RepID=UPI000B8CC69C|nr:probable inactive receptor kinase At5g10020 [Carica papaya]